MRATLIASAITELYRSIRTRAEFCGWELRREELILSISSKSSSADICIAPVTRIVSPLAGSQQFTQIQRVSCGWASPRAHWIDWTERRDKSPIMLSNWTTRTPLRKVLTLIAFTKMRAAICGWLVGVAVLTGSMNGLGSSNITGTTLMIPTACQLITFSVSMAIEVVSYGWDIFTASLVWIR